MIILSKDVIMNWWIMTLIHVLAESIFLQLIILIQWSQRLRWLLGSFIFWCCCLLCGFSWILVILELINWFFLISEKLTGSSCLYNLFRIFDWLWNYLLYALVHKFLTQKVSVDFWINGSAGGFGSAFLNFSFRIVQVIDFENAVVNGNMPLWRSTFDKYGDTTCPSVIWAQ